MGARAAGREPACAGQVYLTLDTGNMRDAQRIAEILARHRVKATFFLANEKTTRGDHALDDGWGEYWRHRVSEGHLFGSHTFDHVYFLDAPLSARPDGLTRVRPQFGARAGRTLDWSPAEVCAEVGRVAHRFRELTGADLAPIWRAPGGRLPASADQAVAGCGYRHVHWSRAGFLGDELPSERYPNTALVERALRDLRGGDILIAHLGIWSRREVFAPALDPLIAGLKARGWCFATLREHPVFGPGIIKGAPRAPG